MDFFDDLVDLVPPAQPTAPGDFFDDLVDLVPAAPLPTEFPQSSIGDTFNQLTAPLTVAPQPTGGMPMARDIGDVFYNPATTPIQKQQLLDLQPMQGTEAWNQGLAQLFKNQLYAGQAMEMNQAAAELGMIGPMYTLPANETPMDRLRQQQQQFFQQQIAQRQAQGQSGMIPLNDLMPVGQMPPELQVFQLPDGSIGATQDAARSLTEQWTKGLPRRTFGETTDRRAEIDAARQQYEQANPLPQIAEQIAGGRAARDLRDAYYSDPAPRRSLGEQIKLGFTEDLPIAAKTAGASIAGYVGDAGTQTMRFGRENPLFGGILGTLNPLADRNLGMAAGAAAGPLADLVTGGKGAEQNFRDLRGVGEGELREARRMQEKASPTANDWGNDPFGTLLRKTPSAAVSSAPAIAAGAMGGPVAGMAVGYLQAAGESWQANLEAIRQAKGGAPLTEDDYRNAVMVATVTAGAVAALEKVGMDEALAKGFLSKAAREALLDTSKAATFQETAKRVVANVTAAVAGEAMTEGAQSGVTSFGSGIAAEMSVPREGYFRAGANAMDLGGMLEETVMGGVVGGVMSLGTGSAFHGPDAPQQPAKRDPVAEAKARAQLLLSMPMTAEQRQQAAAVAYADIKAAERLAQSQEPEAAKPKPPTQPPPTEAMKPDSVFPDIQPKAEEQPADVSESIQRTLDQIAAENPEMQPMADRLREMLALQQAKQEPDVIPDPAMPGVDVRGEMPNVQAQQAMPEVRPQSAQAEVRPAAAPPSVQPEAPSLANIPEWQRKMMQGEQKPAEPTAPPQPLGLVDDQYTIPGAERDVNTQMRREQRARMIVAGTQLSLDEGRQYLRDAEAAAYERATDPEAEMEEIVGSALGAFPEYDSWVAPPLQRRAAEAIAADAVVRAREDGRRGRTTGRQDRSRRLEDRGARLPRQTYQGLMEQTAPATPEPPKPAAPSVSSVSPEIEQAAEQLSKNSNGEIPVAAARKSAAMVLEAIKTGNYSEILHPNNANSRKLFEQLTGQKLPKGVAATKAMFKGQPFTRTNTQPQPAPAVEAAQPQTGASNEEVEAQGRPSPEVLNKPVTPSAGGVVAPAQGVATESTTPTPAPADTLSVKENQDANQQDQDVPERGPDRGAPVLQGGSGSSAGNQPTEADLNGGGRNPEAVRPGDGSQGDADGIRPDAAGDEGTGGPRDGDVAGDRPAAAGTSGSGRPDRTASKPRPQTVSEEIEERRAKLSPEQLNHRIDADDTLIVGGEKEKAIANVAAIKLYRKLKKEGRLPTPEEKKVLAKYVGWGGIPQVFDRFKPDRIAYSERYSLPLDKETENWKKQFGRIAAEIKQLLTPEEWDAAALSTRNAHYTSREIIEHGLWAIAMRLGFKGGTVLESSAGIGHILGLTPGSVEAKSLWTAVELDSTTSGMLEMLYPEATVYRMGFEDAPIDNNSYSLVIGNPPFAADGPKDPRYPDFSLHNYMLAKAIDATVPGGLLVQITSSSTMDAGASAEFREWAASRVDLVGAIRLPNTAFKKNAGTEVTTDILVFRKRDGTVWQGGKRWTLTKPMEIRKPPKWDDAENGVFPGVTEVNEYFHQHPEMMLGVMTREGKLYREFEPALLPNSKDQDTVAMLDQAVAKLPESIAAYDPTKPPKTLPPQPGEKAGNLPAYSFHLRDGKVQQVVDGRFVTPILTKNQMAAAKAMIEIREQARALIDAQINPDMTDDQVEALRKDLNSAYDAFLAKHEIQLAGSEADAILGEDPDYFRLLSALEDVTYTFVDKPQKGGTVRRQVVANYKKADILTKRTQFATIAPKSAENVSDAIAISESWKGRFDIDYIAELLGTDPVDAAEQAIAAGEAFRDPTSNLLSPKREYLSGNVRKKLVAAEAAATRDPQYQQNVEALRPLVPADKPISKIDIKLGAPWIPSHIAEAWINELFGFDAVTIEHVPEVGRTVVTWEPAVIASAQDKALGAGGVLGTKLISDIIAMSEPVGYAEEHYTDDRGRARVREVKDMKKTEAAKDQANKLQDRFESWAKSSKYGPDLVRAYNEAYNATIPVGYQPPKAKYLPGQSTAYHALRPHQATAVARGTRESYVLGHEVGVGKTMVFIATAMEWKRLGLANKTMIVALNANISQIADTIKKMYPNAKVLFPSKADYKTENRQRLLSRIATGDWDIVLVPHSQFNKIDDDVDRKRAFIQQQIDKLVSRLGAASRARSSARGRGPKDPAVKVVEARIKKLKEQLAKLTERNVDNITFDTMGVDGLIVDEAHYYKKAYFDSGLDNVKGLDRNFSERGMGLLLKMRLVQEKTGGRNTILSTGTPVTNTLAEAWNMMRLVRPDVMAQHGISEFDDFAQTFAVTSTESEQDATGRWKQVTRMREFRNADSLSRIFATTSDVVFADDVGIVRPKIKGGAPLDIKVPRSKSLAKVMQALLELFEWFEKADGKTRRENSHIPIWVGMQAKKAAVDPRLYNPDAEGEPDSKLQRSADELMKRWKATDPVRGVQVVFSDVFQSTDEEDTGEVDANGKAIKRKIKPKFNFFHALRDELVKRGVPAKQIAVMTDIDSSTDAGEKKRQDIFDQANAGNIRFVFGTTARLGVGVNIQERLAALHHIDAPYNPADMEQREGRIMRQGSYFGDWSSAPEGEREFYEKYGGAEILRYGVSDTADAGAFQRLARKQRTIRQVVSGKNTQSRIEDLTDPAMTYNEAAAAFSGDPRNRKRFDLAKEVKRLEAVREQHQEKVYEAQKRIRELTDSIAYTKRYQEQNEAWLSRHLASYEGDYTVSVDGTRVLFSKLGDTFQAKLDEAIAKVDAVFKDDDTRARRIKEGMVAVPLTTIEMPGGTITAEYRQYNDRTGSKSNEPIILWRFRSGDISTSGEAKTATGLKQSIARRVPSEMQDNVERCKRHIAEAKADIETYKKTAASEFEDKHELADKKRSLENIIAELEGKSEPAPSPEEAVDRTAGEVAASVLKYPPQTGVLDRLIEWATQKLGERANITLIDRLKNLHRDDAGTLDPAEFALRVLIGAAKIGKGAQRFVTWSKAMIAQFPGTTKAEMMKLWRSARRVRRMSEDERAVWAQDAFKIPAKETTKQTVRRVTGQTERARLVSETDALRAKFQAAQAASAKGYKAGVDETTAMRKELVRLINETLPAAEAGKLLNRVASLKSMTGLRYGIQKLREVLADYDVKQAVERFEKMAGKIRLQQEGPQKPEPMGAETETPQEAAAKEPKEPRQKPVKLEMDKLTPENREKIKPLLDRAKNIKAGLLAATTIDEKYAGIAQMKEVYADIAQIVVEDRAAREVKVLDRVIERDRLVEDLIGKVNPTTEPESATAERPREAGLFRRLLGRKSLTMETIATHMDPEKGDIYNLTIQNVRNAQERYYEGERAWTDHLAKALAAAGIPSGSAKLDSFLNKKETLTLPDAGKITMTRNHMVGLLAAAGDVETNKLILEGVPFTFREQALAPGFTLTMEDINAIYDHLTPGERELVKAFTAFNEQQITKPLMQASLDLRGTAPDPHEGYFPRKRNRKQNPVEGAPTGWRDIFRKANEEISSLQERADDIKQPLFVPEFIQDAYAYVEDALRIMHIAEPVRSAAVVWEDPRVRSAIQRRFGDSMNRRTDQFLVDTSQVRLTPPKTTIEKLFSGLARNFSRAVLQANPKPMLKNVLGGTLKLMGEFDMRDWAAGVTKMFSPDVYRRMIANSGVAWHRYHDGMYGSYSVISEKHVEAVANLDFWEAIKARRIGAALDAIKLMAWADSVPFRAAYAAAEAFVDRTMPGATPEERKQAVLTKFHDATYNTQNGTSSTELSGLASDVRRNVMLQPLLAFTSDSNKSYNMLAKLKNADNTTRAKVVAAIMLNALASAAVTAGFGAAARAIGHAYAGGEPPEDEKKKAAKRALADVIRNLAGTVYFGSDLADVLMEWLGEGKADFSTPTGRVQSDTAKAVVGLGKAVLGYVGEDGGSAGEASAKDRVMKSINEASKAAEAILGVPLLPWHQMAEQTVKAAGNTVDPRVAAKRAESKALEEKREDLPNNVTSALSRKNKLDAIGYKKLTPAERAEWLRLRPMEAAYERWRKAVKAKNADAEKNAVRDMGKIADRLKQVSQSQRSPAMAMTSA